jgi:hypothetical protein
MLKQQAMTILWPSFLMAGVLEMLVFVVFDPADMRWPGGASLDLSSVAAYTITFLIFWAVIAISGALTTVLLRPAEVVNSKSWPR